MRVGVSLSLALLLLAGCYPVNRQLAHYDPVGGYRYETLTADDPAGNGDETFVILTFSGGGTRAGAFAYGVLDELRRTPLTDGRTLLDEVDIMSSVSGGSFASAYYGLFGQEAFFRDFKDAVLYRKLEYGLALRILAPWNWPRLLSPYFARADLAEEYYDHTIFQGRRFADLPKRRPFIILNATDISEGAVFSFTQPHFDRLCSDLSEVRVARGVAASSAFPVAFTPLTLKNYSKSSCEYKAPTWVLSAMKDAESNPPRYRLAVNWRSYEDAAIRPFIHLSDGGLADNIGLRSPLNALALAGSWGIRKKINDGVVRRIVVIVVDAKPKAVNPRDLTPAPPSFYAVLNAAATTPMENYSADTVELLRSWFYDWDEKAEAYDLRRARCDKLAAGACGRQRSGCVERHKTACYETFSVKKPPAHPDLSLIHVRFEAIPDPAARLKLQQVDTRLQLPRDEVDELIDWGARLLRESPEYQKLIENLP